MPSTSRVCTTGGSLETEKPAEKLFSPYQQLKRDALLMYLFSLDDIHYFEKMAVK